MEFEINPEELFEYAKSLGRKGGSFSFWASCHIEHELKSFLEEKQRNENESQGQIHPLLIPNEEYYLNYDGYWLLLCKDYQEVMQLLRSWYSALMEK